jgi:hypothetical protein
MGRVDADELERVKERIAEQFTASPGSDLEAMMRAMTLSLEQSPMLRNVVARKTGGHAHLIEVECQLATSALALDAALAEIERIWLEELRYDDFAAHAIEQTDEHAIFDFLTAARDQRLYLSGMIVVRFG